MSKQESTHIEALKAVSRALDDLADAKYVEARSLSMDTTGEDAYDAAAHLMAIGQHSGICAAVLEVYGLIHQARESAA